MHYIGFEEAVDCGICIGAGEEEYLNAYRISREKAVNAVKRHTQSYQKYYLRERRLGSLILLRTKGLTKELFWILDKCEQDGSAELIYEIYDEVLQREHINWVDLLYIMSRLDDASVRCLAERYFTEGSYSKEKYASWLGSAIAPVFHEHFGRLKHQYYRLVRAIASVVKCPDLFLGALEHRMKTLEEQSARGTRFIGMKDSAHEAYFTYLCETQAYKAANSFLDRIWKPKKNPGCSQKTLFGKELEEVRSVLLQIPYPSILTTARKYIQAWDADYTEDDWYKEIQEYVRRDGAREKEWQAIFRWIEVNLSAVRLHQLLVIQESDRAIWLPELECLTASDMFDVKKYSYMTQLCNNLAEIIQTWMLDETMSDKELIRYLRKLDDKNVFAYDLYDWYTSPYRSYDKIINLDWEALKNRLRRAEDVRDAVYLFFHTPLWLRTDFYAFLRLLQEKFTEAQKEDSLQVLLDDYAIAGEIIYENRLTSGKGKLQLIPTHLYWERAAEESKNIRKSGNVLTKKYARTIWVHETCLTHGAIVNINEFSPRVVFNYQGRALTQPRSCVFKVAGLEEETVFAMDLKKTADEQMDTEVDPAIKEQFLENLDLWMNDISLHKRAINWGEWTDNGTGEAVGTPLKVKFALSMEQRADIAERMACLLISLAEDDEDQARKLMRKCSFPPLENVNEFRYIAAQHWTDFTADNVQRERIYSLAQNRLVNNEAISPESCIEIYMNTCIRNVYPLEELLEKEELRKAFFSKNPEWIVPVVYVPEEQHRENSTVFFMRSLSRRKQPVVKSDCQFIFPREFRLRSRKKTVVYATITSVPYKGNGTFGVGRVYTHSEKLLIEHFPWTTFKRCYYDLKDKLNERALLNVYKILSKVKVEFDAYDKIIQIINELHSVFSKQRYDVHEIYTALMLLGEKNVCFDPDGKYEDHLSYGFSMKDEDSEKLQQNLETAYEKLLNNQREKSSDDRNSIEHIGAVYYLSYFRVWMPEEKFIEDLAVVLEVKQDEVKKELSKCKTSLNCTIREWQTTWKNRLEEAEKEQRETEEHQNY